MTKKKEVATIIVIEENKFLVLRRSKTSSGSGFWNFPGGSVEEGEEISEAAVRELKEEADLDVNSDDTDYLGTLTTKYLNIHFFITDEYSGTVKINKESDDFRWIGMDDLDKHLFVGGGKLHQSLLTSMENYIEG